MTREELKKHCEKQIEMCEMRAISKGKKPSGNIYEEHKLILELLEQQPCEDVIDRAEAMTEIMMFAKNVKSDEEDIYIKVSDAVQLLRDLPSVTAQSKKGHWIKDYDNSALDGLYHCSVCGRKLWIPKEESVSDYPYCYCGAEMKGDE